MTHRLHAMSHGGAVTQFANEHLAPNLDQGGEMQKSSNTTGATFSGMHRHPSIGIRQASVGTQHFYGICCSEGWGILKWIIFSLNFLKLAIVTHGLWLTIFHFCVRSMTDFENTILNDVLCTHHIFNTWATTSHWGASLTMLISWVAFNLCYNAEWTCQRLGGCKGHFNAIQKCCKPRPCVNPFLYHERQGYIDAQLCHNLSSLTTSKK